MYSRSDTRRTLTFLTTGLLLSFTTATFAAEKKTLPQRISSGVAWIAFDATPRTFGTGTHPNAGWDFHDDSQKQFWVGSGWKSGGADHSGKWGLWDARGNAFSFSHPVARDRTDRLVVRVDFGEPQQGDESLHLWVNPDTKAEPELSQADAVISGMSLSGFDVVSSFSGGGSRYEMTTPRVTETYSALTAAESAPSEPSEQSAGSSGESSSAAGSMSQKDAERLFVARIKPLLDRKCFACHGNDSEKIQGGLNLLSRGDMLQGGESGEPALVPGKPEESLLYSAIRWQSYEMPPKENDRLSAEEIELFRAWIADGAPWPDESRQKEIANRAEAEWNSGDGTRVKTSGGLSEEWTNRRYDPADLWAFQPIKQPQVPWESLDADQPRHPIDAFVRRQLNESGLPPAPAALPETLIRRVSYGLNGLPPTADEIEAFKQDASPAAYEDLIARLLASRHYGERMAQHWLDVVRYADTNGYSRDEFRPDAWKYRDYVVRSFNEDKPYQRFIREQIAADELARAPDDPQSALGFLWMGPWEHTNMSVAAETRQLWLDDVANSVGVTFLAQELRCASCHDHKFDPIPTRDYYRMQAVFASADHSKGGGKYEIRPRKPEETHILLGGSLQDEGERVAPGVLSAVDAQADVPTDASGRRAALADWVASPHNPLTARVIVNRVWQWHFGTGLVATANNFGKTGTKPTHPELLDYLASWFMENGWSVKKLHRLILTSEAYRRSGQHPRPDRVGEIDPDNELLSYFPPRRLSAEEIRDTMLVVSGELNEKVGGPSVYPEINWEVAFQPRLLMGKLAPPYEPSSKRAERNRRTLYAVRIRGLGNPMLEVLNQPGSDTSCAHRDETTVTPQAFTLLHGEFTHNRSLALAAMIAEQSADNAARVREAYRLVYGRRPTAAEQSRALQYLDEITVLHRAHKVIPNELPTSVTLQNVKELTGELETTTFKLKNLQNYEEDLKAWQVGPETRALAGLCLVLFNSSEFLYVY